MNDPIRADMSELADKTLLEFVRILKAQEHLTNDEIALLIGRSVSAFYDKRKRLDEGSTRASARVADVYAAALRISKGSAAVALHEWDLLELVPDMTSERLEVALKYLVRYGLLSQSRAKASREYRFVPHSDAARSSYYEAMIALYMYGPLTIEGLAERLSQPREHCMRLIAELRTSGYLVEEQPTRTGESVRYSSSIYHIRTDEPHGWHMALWVHFRAVCEAIIAKLQGRSHVARPGDACGGTTFEYDVPRDHPLFNEINGFLAENRVRMDAWLAAVGQIGQPLPHERSRWARITIYTGQMTSELEPTP